MNKKFYNLAELTFQVSSDLPISEYTFHPKFKLFETECLQHEPIFFIHHHFKLSKYVQETIETKPFFERAATQIFRQNSIMVIKRFPIFDTDFQRTLFMKIDENHESEIDVFCDGMDDALYEKLSSPSLTLFATDQFLLSWLFAKQKSCFFHGNGFELDGKGYVIIGKSGAGKSTLSAMLKKNKIEILGDDRILLRSSDDGIDLIGTWVHGSHPDYSNRILKLHGIFILEQANFNKIVQAKDQQIIFSSLVSSLVRPFISRGKWNNILSVVEAITRSIPLYKIFFDKSGKITKLINQMEFS